MFHLVNPILRLANSLSILIIICIVIISIQVINQSVFSQHDLETSVTMMTSTDGSEESITSYIDALIKAPLLVAQCAIVGIVFGRIVISRIFYKHVLMYSKGTRDSPRSIDLDIAKRFFLIIILSAIALLVSGTGLFMLQAYNLSSELGLDLFDTFSLLIDTSIFTTWLLRIITSILILILEIIYYVSVRRDPTTRAVKKIISNINKNDIILIIIFIVGSINIVSNGMVSHNAAVDFLPWLAISIDWFHIMAVSIWLGGLFYISLLLLHMIRTSSRNLVVEGIKSDQSKDERIVARNSFALAIMLPYFSMIAIICLGVIGISGLYMAWLQLQSIESLFDSAYGNILILKLCVIFPMITLGAYHQVKLHTVMVQIAQRRNKSQEEPEVFLSNRGALYDPFLRFSKTVKTESLIGIAVLIVASFLTITSPPSMVHSVSQLQMDLPVSGNGDGNGSETTPEIADGLSIAALILAAVVLILCLYYYRRNKEELKTTADILRTT
jgi:copper transport protein